jgi:hypothetical protein
MKAIGHLMAWKTTCHEMLVIEAQHVRHFFG